jgi:hypothetical protein
MHIVLRPKKTRRHTVGGKSFVDQNVPVFNNLDEIGSEGKETSGEKKGADARQKKEAALDKRASSQACHDDDDCSCGTIRLR